MALALHQAFLEFVLAQYVNQGVDELDQEKLSSLLEFRYHTVDDAAAQLGNLSAVREAFVGFQPRLYELAPCAAASFDANATADLNARVRSRDLREARAILRTRNATNWMGLTQF